jgi:hypothetical protein
VAQSQCWRGYPAACVCISQTKWLDLSVWEHRAAGKSATVNGGFGAAKREKSVSGAEAPFL